MADNKQGMMFLLSGEVTYHLNSEPEAQKKLTLNALHFLDHNVVWPEDLENMYKALVLNATKMLSRDGISSEEITPEGVVVFSISLMGACTVEDWEAHRTKVE